MMKGLLHSKRFRKNLGKWLFIYIGIMLCLVTIITYSKYVSTLMGDDSAHVAKFDIDVEPAECNNDTNEETINCNVGIKRPTAEIEYFFNLKADTDVKTETFLTVMLNKRFKLIKVEDITNSENSSIVFDGEPTSEDIYTGGGIESFNLYSFKAVTFKAGTKETKKYRATIKFIPADTYDYSNIVDQRIYDILRVRFSATQLDR